MSDNVMYEKVLPVTVRSNKEDERRSTNSREQKLLFRVAQTRNTSGGTDLDVRITDEDDPYFLYTLRISDEDFSNLRRTQNIKVDYTCFPRNLVQLLDQSISPENTTYMLELEVPEVAGGHATVNVVETNNFKNLVHLSLKLVPGNDASIKKHLAACLHALKTEKDITVRQMEATIGELTTRLTQAEESSRYGAETTHTLQAELSTLTNRLTSQHAAELARVKEDYVTTQSEMNARMEKSLRLQGDREAMKTTSLETRIEELAKQSSELLSSKNTLEAKLLEVESKLRSAETLCATLETDLKTSRSENMELRRVKHEQECTLNENRVRLAELGQEIKGKNESERHQIHLAEVANDNRTQMEKAMQAQISQKMELQNALKTASKEIQKGNSIIMKLQKELGSLHSKLDARSGVIVQQEQIVATKDKELVRLDRLYAEKSNDCDLLRNSNTEAQENIKRLTEEIESQARTLKNNEGIISWLNKQLNGAAHTNNNFNFLSENTDPVAKVRPPFGTKSSNDINRRHIQYLPKKVEVGGNGNGNNNNNSNGNGQTAPLSHGNTHFTQDDDLFQRYLPKNKKIGGGNRSQAPTHVSPHVNMTADQRSRIPQPQGREGKLEHTPPTKEMPYSTNSTENLLRRASAVFDH